MTASHWRQLPGDWCSVGMPPNVNVGADAYLDSSYGFAQFHSHATPGLVLGAASGVYDRAAVVTGPAGRVTVGSYTVLNGCYVICHEQISIGAHVLIAWGVVITDTWDGALPVEARRALLAAAAAHPGRGFPPMGAPRPVRIEDNAWVGFDSVVLPGVTIGRGAVVGARTIVREDIPPYAVVAGDPPRVIRLLDPDDTEAARTAALAEYRTS